MLLSWTTRMISNQHLNIKIISSMLFLVLNFYLNYTYHDIMDEENTLISKVEYQTFPNVDL